MRYRHALMLFFAAAAQPARAEWLESASTHFVIYGDSSEKNLRALSEQLERYHSGMVYLTGANTTPPSPSNRVTVYIVGSESDVRKYHKGANRYVAGFYAPRAGASLAVIPKVQSARSADRTLDFAMIVLLHEYAHHFMISSSSFPTPRWMGEGSAEFFASASFNKDGSLTLGRPAMHRANGLYLPEDVTVTDLIDPDQYERRRGKSKAHDAYYGKAWLLYHYLAFNEGRRGQMKAYIDAMIAGKTSAEAGLAAFGSLAVLEKELDGYLGQRNLSALKLLPEMLKVGAVGVRRLTPGEAAVLPLRIRSTLGISAEAAPALLAEAKAVAARFPGDPAVLAELAEAEHDAGNYDASIAAAEAAIKIDQRTANAHIQRGLSLLRKAQASGEAAHFEEARKAFLALNRIENDHPIPLVQFYTSFLLQKRTPTANAVKALQRASELAPFDLDLRMVLAMQYLRTGQRDLARANLGPVAYNPHGGMLADVARTVMARMEADKTWDGADFTMPVTDEKEDNLVRR